MIMFAPFNTHSTSFEPGHSVLCSCLCPRPSLIAFFEPWDPIMCSDRQAIIGLRLAVKSMFQSLGCPRPNMGTKARFAFPPSFYPIPSCPTGLAFSHTRFWHGFPVASGFHPLRPSDQNTIARMRHPALAAISAEAVQLPNWQPGGQPTGGPGADSAPFAAFCLGGVGGVRIRIHFPKAPLENQPYRGKLENSLLPGQREWQINRLDLILRFLKVENH